MANDTIVAPATAPGESAVAVTRLSGPSALEIAARRFRGRSSPERSASHRILFGAFLADDGSRLDTVLLSVFRAPHSYTGEDVVEISSHGGLAIPRAILDALVAEGARPARAGEFTERAFRNGKLDLAQAESVAALVRARSERAAKAAEAALGGALSRRIEALDRELVSILAEVEARIDFPAEAGEPLDGMGLAARCAALAAPLRDWVDRLPSERRRREGLRVPLLGPPNVGKSSLLNALVGYERAIVSEAPGTTRDTVEESIWLDGVELRLSDTAGIRESEDPIERLGLDRTSRAAKEADLAVLVLDRSEPPTHDGRAAAAAVLDRPVVVAWNKADLAPRSADASTSLDLRAPQLLAQVETVAVRPGGAAALLGALRSAVPLVLGAAAGDEVGSTSVRQESLLAEALAALERAGRGLGEDLSCDLVAVDLSDARRLLGEVVGRGVDHEVIAAVFSRFCIGK